MSELEHDTVTLGKIPICSYQVTGTEFIFYFWCLRSLACSKSEQEEQEFRVWSYLPAPGGPININRIEADVAVD